MDTLRTNRGGTLIHGLLRESVSSDILLYRLDPVVILSDSLVILKKEFGCFGTVSTERTQEKAWSGGWKHLLDSEIGRKSQKES